MEIRLQISAACSKVIEDEGLDTQLISFAGKKNSFAALPVEHAAKLFAQNVAKLIKKLDS